MSGPRHGPWPIDLCGLCVDPCEGLFISHIFNRVPRYSYSLRNWDPSSLDLGSLMLLCPNQHPNIHYNIICRLFGVLLGWISQVLIMCELSGIPVRMDPTMYKFLWASAGAGSNILHTNVWSSSMVWCDVDLTGILARRSPVSIFGMDLCCRT